MPEALEPDAIAVLARWVGEAEAAGLPLPSTMTLATAGPDGAHHVSATIDRGEDRDSTAYRDQGIRSESERLRLTDPSLLDTFVAAVDHANGAPARPWWEYSRERLARESAHGGTVQPA